ncbi:SEC-C metal-binding domain-containing protein [Clostridium sp.]|uniref:SEC-C metal-binding domain-containing protein n=1 Tax=Clostridium sp. TaxID=1506 RepID=UPI00291292FB|nr:SEC-C metal-binding domain-containing protein [Clostridium sp.]MDU6364140.1 SEC-C metal-binding domain-containing protein [Clostridium sp.]MDU7362877.1 SEC-C metal-binding domain-containing protein [Clostridium sp.]
MDKDISKIQEDIIKKDIRKVEKLWKDVEENNTLEYHLDRMTKDELVKVASNYSVRGITSLKKADAVNKVKDGLINNIDYVLELLDLDAFLYLEEIVKLDGKKEYFGSELINANYFRNRGIMFTGIDQGKLYVITPKELCDIIKDKLNDNLKSIANNNSDIIKLSAGLIYFYGVLTIEELSKILKEEYNFDFEDEKFKKLLLIGEEVGFDYQIEEDFVYHIDVEDPIFLMEERNKNTDINFAKFDRKTLLKAAKPDYIEENKQANKLEKVLNELFVIDKNILREEIDSFSIAIKNEAPLDEAIDTFLEAYEIESEEENEILKEELKKLSLGVKRWTLKGFTQGEIDNKKKTIVNEEKVGRNDPCLCGSNKKYKKCCGK